MVTVAVYNLQSDGPDGIRGRTLSFRVGLLTALFLGPRLLCGPSRSTGDMICAASAASELFYKFPKLL